MKYSHTGYDNSITTTCERWQMTKLSLRGRENCGELGFKIKGSSGDWGRAKLGNGKTRLSHM